MSLTASGVTLSLSSRIFSGLREGSDQEGPADRGGGSAQIEPQWGGGALEERPSDKQHPGRGIHPARRRPGLLFWLRLDRVGPQYGRVRDAW